MLPLDIGNCGFQLEDVHLSERGQVGGQLDITGELNRYTHIKNRDPLSLLQYVDSTLPLVGFRFGKYFFSILIPEINSS